LFVIETHCSAGTFGVHMTCHGEALEMTDKQLQDAIRELGLTVTKIYGEWRINYRGGQEATAYYTSDKNEALDRAKAMALFRGMK
jgi:hypothetical protein